MMLDSIPGTLMLTDCLEQCQSNDSCSSVNYETGLCILFTSNADKLPGKQSINLRPLRVHSGYANNIHHSRERFSQALHSGLTSAQWEALRKWNGLILKDRCGESVPGRKFRIPFRCSRLHNANIVSRPLPGKREKSEMKGWWEYIALEPSSLIVYGRELKTSRGAIIGMNRSSRLPARTSLACRGVSDFGFTQCSTNFIYEVHWGVRK